MKLAAVVAGALVASLHTAAPARLQVTAHEFSFGLSRASLKAGPAIVELVNFGEDPHDLRLQRVGARHIAGTPLVQAGDHYDLSLRLAPGKYVLWCSVADHRARGMHATIVVRR